MRLRRRARPDAVDPRLAEYVAANWDALLAAVADDDLDREAVVLDALARVARTHPADDAELDRVVHREIARAAARRRRSQGAPAPSDRLAAVHVVEVMPWALDADMPDPETPHATAQAAGAGFAASSPVEALRARIRRARRQRAAWLAGAAAVAVVAVVLGLTGGGGSGPAAGVDGDQGNPSMQPVALPSSAESRPTGVAAGGGHLWTIELHPSGRRPETTVVERDPATGRQQATYRVPGEDFGIAYALERVWVWGVESGIRNASVITELDPGSGARLTRALNTDVIDAAGFTAHRAWFTEDGLARVVAVAPGGRSRAFRLRLPDANHIASTGPGSIVASGNSNVMQQLPAGRPVVAGSGPPTLLASTPTFGLWIGDGTDLSYRPAVAAATSLRLQLPLRAALVMGDPARGVYVATSSNDPQHFDPYLVYYSPRALRAPAPQPSARLDGRVRVESMAAGRHGGLVFVTTGGQIDAWNPAVVLRSPGSDHVGHALG